MKNLKYILAAFSILLVFAAAVPYIFPLIDNTAFIGNYRIPYSMGYDYFLYSRYSNRFRT
jgi:hypothetical protein